MSKIDLHIHSNFSDDGEFSPGEIMAQCKAQGMEVVAIADHNSVRGVPEALAAADGLQVIPGVELDCTYSGRNFHLLGYGFDYTRGEFLEVEQNILVQERAAGEEKIRLFRKATDIPVNLIDVLAGSSDGVITGEMIAEHLLVQENAAQYKLLQPYLPGGAKSDMPNVRFYWDFFSEDKAAYVPIHYMSLTEAVALIHGAGGIAVLAHPGQNLGDDTWLLPGIVSEGIDGIEAFSSYHTRETTEFYLNAARENHLMVTCGSDFHGKNKPNICLGGHSATWSDQELMDGLADRIGILWL